ncbi:MAG: hypothetical protein HKL80_01485 [Acidimicrobiales bacterium]|nr:hypothetical protein [Acidimicrobiales bacterium]
MKSVERLSLGGGVGFVKKAKAAEVAKRYVLLIIVVVVLLAIVVAFPTVDVAGKGAKIDTALLGSSLSQKSGLTVNKTLCGKGIRQVSWSKYSPYCIPVWNGNNGGATSPGVTGSTITITYREPNTAGMGIMEKLFGSQMGTNQEAIDTMQGYVSLFNKSFELYGRKVVLKPYAGQGDFINELQGQGLEQAQADSITAKNLQAFADVSLLSSTQVYDQYLASEHIISIGAIAQPQYWFQQFAPYVYTPVDTCSIGVQAISVAMGRAMANLPAIFAGDPALRQEKRSFGLIFPEDPTYASCGNELVNLVKEHYGISFARVVEYKISLSDESSEALSDIA